MMKKILKRVAAVLLSVLLLAGSIPAAGLNVFAADYSGACGAEGYDLTWSLDTAAGELTVSGTGEMNDYTRYVSSPWYAYSDIIKTVNIGNGVTRVGDRAFYDCGEIVSVTLPNSVTAVGGGAFYNCKKLARLTLGGSETTIGDGAFYGCEALTGLIIPDSVTAIGYSAFRGCGGLTSLTFGKGVKTVGNRAFDECLALTGVYYTGTLAHWCGISFGEYGANPVSYAHDLYINNKLLTAAEIPDGVTALGNNVFCGCESLAGVTIPKSVTSIGSNAFYGCTGLMNVTVPEGVTTIGDGAFYGCAGLTDVTIPGSMTGIGAEAFLGCGNISNLTVPEGVAAIGHNAFSGVGNVIYGGSAEGAPWGAKNINKFVEGIFVFDSSLKKALISCDTAATGEVRVSDGVESIGRNAFLDCKDITGAVIPESVTAIGDYAFMNCTGLTDITVPDSVTDIGACAFYGCKSLKSLKIGSGVTAIGRGTFEDCAELSAVTIPEGVTAIGNAAFAGCKALTEVTLPNSVIQIDDAAFMGCAGLTKVVLGSNIENIGVGAFYDCAGINNVYYSLSREQWEEINISSGNEALTLAEIHYDWEAPVHKHSYTERVFAPTCTEDGSTVYTCACGDSYTEVIPAPGHSFTNYVYNNDATTEKDGTKTARCDRCDARDTVTAEGTRLAGLPQIIIRNYTENKTVDYKATVTFRADVVNPVADGQIHWFIDGQDRGTGDTYTVEKAKKSFNIQAKYVKNGKAVAESGVEKVNVKTGFFAKLQAFFRALFGKLPKVVQRYPGAEIKDKTV